MRNETPQQGVAILGVGAVLVVGDGVERVAAGLDVAAVHRRVGLAMGAVVADPFGGGADA